ncbi:hypothetical protein JTB14_021295 [Gonioctena quinquepunctata]|nr:hypothetical protein JTB14_021295 [Gonioctena quinquepunctata]
MEPSYLPHLAFSSLKEAEHSYQENGSFGEGALEIIHSFFGENLILATELLEKCKLIEYSVENGMRKIFKIVTTKEQFTIYENINFCFCETFHLQVLKLRTSLTCKHVLAVKLGQITNHVIREKVTGSQLVDFLNEQLNFLEDEQT